MGNEWMQAGCAEKIRNRSTFANVLPVFLASLIVGLLCYSLMRGAGLAGAGIAVAAVLIIGMTSFMAIMDRKQKKVLAEIGIRVSEDGISGKYAQGFSKAVDFSYSYAEIKAVEAKRLNLVILPKNGRPFSLALDEAEKFAEAIRAGLAH